MRRLILLLILLLLALVLFFFFKGSPEISITSNFDSDNEGWEVLGDAQQGSAQPDYVDKEGNPSGHLTSNDNTTGGIWYWNAPEKFLGDMSAIYGGEIAFSLKQSSTNSQFDADDVVLLGGDMRIVFNTENNPDTTWTNYRIDLKTASGWLYDSSQGKPVNEQDFITVLSNLKAFHIRGEFVTGEDTGAIDNIVMSSH